MPLEYWGLERWPFLQVAPTHQFYPTAAHDEALARMEFLVEGRRRVGVLLGDSGVGKSLMLRVAAARLARRGCAVVVIESLGLSTREMLWQLACGLQTAPRDDADVAWLWRRLADRVIENRLQQRATVLLVDEAGQAGPDLTTQLARLARLDPHSAAQWTMILAAEPAQAARWNSTLQNAVDLRIELGTWSPDDTVGYLQTALVECGRLEPVFEPDALDRIHECSGGLPRQVNRLADYALLAGAAAKVDSIDSALVEAAYEEIAWSSAVGVCD